MGHIPVAKPSPMPVWKVPRRGFAVACILAGFAMLIIVVVTASYPTETKVDQITGTHWVPVARVDDLETDQPVLISDQRLWLVKLNTGEIVALSRKDPRGCTLPWRPDFEFDNAKGWFRDPCLGSTYDLNGHKVYGPSPRGLDQYPVEVKNGNVQVLVGPGALIESAPSEAKPYRH